MELDAKQIYEKLEQIDGKVDALVSWKSAMDERCKAHRERTDEIHHTVYGNPDGLELQVSNLIHKLDRNTTNRNKVREFFLFILKMLVVAATIGFFTWLFSADKGG